MEVENKVTVLNGGRE